ncbi:transposition protein TniB (plasmid) [Deinococcus aetherius]|uniref:Transposition protein TniB n=1 Tax=Deinococcus aetherius TaxID=200252 RepID=A0ABN6RKW1_9DEIO|nr:TniB family NTP-binding protein [Deinococcus aetherius]BDP43359.1 transposition protein TniB [Deinococcus aetherius]
MFEHLGPEARAVLELGDEERIAYMQRQRWFDHDHAKLIMKRLESLLKHERNNRMPCVAITAETNNGKTLLLERFEQDHPPMIVPVPGGHRTERPVLRVSLVEDTTNIHIYRQILTAAGVPYPRRPDSLELLKQIQHTIENITKTRIIAIDEGHNIRKYPPRQLENALGALRSIATECKVTLVMAGLPEMLFMLNSDRQLENRFKIVYELPRWTEGLGFQQLLKAFEQGLPLREPSNLFLPPLAPRLLELSGGLIGELHEILARAGEEAIHNKKEYINVALLEEMGFVSPMARRVAKESQVGVAVNERIAEEAKAQLQDKERRKKKTRRAQSIPPSKSANEAPKN